MRSIIKPSPEARYSSAFSVEIFVKDYIFSCLSARNLGGNLHVKSEDLNGPEIYLIILLSSQKISCRRQHLKQRFPPKISCARATKNIRLNSDDPMDHGPPRYSTMSLTSRAENHLLVFLYPCFARAAVRGWQRQIHDIRRLTAVCGAADGKYLSAKSFLV